MRFFTFLILLANCLPIFSQNIEFRSRVTYPSEMSDVWGYSDGENEYALATYEDGTSIVDVTDPDNPTILHDIPGPNTFWRDVKTYGHYAYVIHEDVGIGNTGLLIIDLSQLPAAAPHSNWVTDGGPEGVFLYAHNIFIDENGIAYLVGHNLGGGVLMLDLNDDPENPEVVGSYNQRYVHDCFARNDTLWTADVGSGIFSVIDVRFKSAPNLLATQATPFTFTHNIWISDDGRTAFTTDERTGATLAAYDVSDLNDITLLDEYRSASNVIPHNAFVKDDFVVISYYSHGIIILDATYPDEMVEMGRYDTAPSFPGPGFHGAWGVYPYLPSGNILVTDIERGLFVLTPTYKKATHIRGSVRVMGTEIAIGGAQVNITGEGSETENTDLEGNFRIGFTQGGIYNIEVSKPGFVTVNLQIEVEDGALAELEIELEAIVYVPTDTLFDDLFVESEVKICDMNTDGIEVDEAFICGGSTSSAYGSYSVDNNGCLGYVSYDQPGEFIDSICFVVQNSTTGEFNVNIAIITINNNPATAVLENAFEDGRLTLVNNPVQRELVIQTQVNSLDNLELSIVDMSGRFIKSIIANSASSDLRIPIEYLSDGFYILTVQSGNNQLGHIKFVKQ